MMIKGEYIYFFVDVNNLRKYIDYLLLEGELEELTLFSSRIRAGIDAIVQSAVSELNAEVIFYGGDDVFFRVNRPVEADSVTWKYQKMFFGLTGVHISFGAGADVESCLIDLKRRKALSKA